MWRNRIEQTVIGLCVKPSEARADVGKAWAEAVAEDANSTDTRSLWAPVSVRVKDKLRYL